MTIGSILLGVALLVVVGIFVARPFLMPAAGRQEDESESAALAVQKEAILTEIRDLDFDHETGKVPDEAYESLRQQLLAEAALILKALDATQPAGVGMNRDQDIESAIARMRRQPATTEAVSGEAAVDEIEAAVARLRKQEVPAAATNGQPAAGVKTRKAATRQAGFCPQCGEARDGEDKFCAYCGHAFA